jgi:large subunit ribosomal protein L31
VCGAKYEIYSTQKQVRLDICSACHPLFTGQSKLLDTEGRVDRFKKRYAKTAASTKK